MVARLLRTAALVVVTVVTVWAASQLGRRYGLIAGLCWLVALGTMWWWLPRAAHRRFQRGEYRRSALYYAVLRRFRLAPASRAAIDVSRAACALAAEEWQLAGALLDRTNPDRLPPATRAAWLNNRAYAYARGAGDYAAALELAEQALELRPDVAGFRHTRGLALLGLGRLDEAVRELDALWREIAGDDARALLEAERCYDLGRAWANKGERDYARDYFVRAQRAAPDSRWAARARDELRAGGGAPAAALADFIEG